jgi:LPXTG-motif cell wall-anchored protein
VNQKKVCVLGLILIMVIGLIPGMTAAAENNESNEESEEQDELEELIIVEAPELVILGDSQEAEIKLMIKVKDGGIEDILEVDNLEIILPDGLDLVDPDLSLLTRVKEEDGGLNYKGFKLQKIEPDEDSVKRYQLKFRVKVTEKYRAKDDKVNLEHLIENVKMKVHAKQKVQDDVNAKVIVKEINFKSQQTFDLKEHYKLSFKKDHVLFEYKLDVKAKGDDLPESIVIHNPIPTGAELVLDSFSEEGSFNQAERTIKWDLKVESGEIRQKIHYKLKLGFTEYNEILAKWDRKVKIKTKGLWVDWQFKEHEKIHFDEKILIDQKGKFFSKNKLHLNYFLESKVDIEQKINLKLNGLEKWKTIFYLDIDGDGRISDIDKKLDGKLHLKGRKKVQIIVVCEQPDTQVNNQLDISLSANIEGVDYMEYVIENVITLNEDNDSSQDDQNITNENNNEGAGVENSGTQSTQPQDKYGLNQLPKTGSDIPKYWWYLAGAFLLALGTGLQCRKWITKLN